MIQSHIRKLFPVYFCRSLHDPAANSIEAMPDGLAPPKFSANVTEMLEPEAPTATVYKSSALLSVAQETAPKGSDISKFFTDGARDLGRQLSESNRYQFSPGNSPFAF